MNVLARAGMAALLALSALTFGAGAGADEARRLDPSCTALDPGDIAAKFGFPAGPVVQSLEEGSCGITFKSAGRASLQLDFVHFAKASDASQEFHADVEPGSEKISGLGDEALLESRDDGRKWTRRLTALRGDASVDVIYEGDPIPAGADKAKAELIAIAAALLNVAAKAPVTTIEEPKCDKPGASDACPIEVDFPEGDGAVQRVYTGTIGKIPIWSYSAPVKTGQTVTIRFKGPRGMLGEVDCPGVEAGEPNAIQSSVKAKLDGECLISVGIDFGEAHGTGPYTLTIERK
jgi:hypothetical protein